MLTRCVQRLNGIVATTREPPGPEDTPEKLEAERAAAQEFIDTGKHSLETRIFETRSKNRIFATRVSPAEPLTEEEQALKEKYSESGFHDWSRRDFQQFVRALESYGWYVVGTFDASRVSRVDCYVRW
jgi:SWI/SNF-related matrix-associated actin-dependent regulator of chromatin subfamily A member 5